jgi:hypothetical protein
MPRHEANPIPTPLDVMRRLRAIVVNIGARRPLADADRAWFCERFGHYEMEAPISGVTLDKAFGLAASVGRSTWWSQEQLELRDKAIRTIADGHFRDMGIADQARQIEREVRLIACGRPSRLPAEAQALIQKALTGQRVFPEKSQLKNILRNK